MDTKLPLGQKIGNWIEVSPVSKGLIRVRSTIVEKCLKEGINLVVANQADLSLCTVLDGHALAMESVGCIAMTYQNEVEGSYVLMQYSYKEDNSLKYMTKAELQMLARFHPSWFNALRDYFNTQDFKDALKQVKEERQTKNIYPSGDKMFRIFGETNLNNVKAVICFQDPYSQSGVATGIPLAVEKGDKKPVSLRKFESALGVNIVDTMFTKPIKQGILFLNTAWTVQEGIPNSHSILWERFTTCVMQAVGRLWKQKVIILAGKNAQSYEHFIGPQHIVMKCEHPSKAAHEKRDWNDNKALECLTSYFNSEYNGLTIDWIGE